MNVANAHYHSCFISGLAVQVTNTGARSHGYEASAEPHRTCNESTAAVQSSPEGNSNVMLPLLNNNNNNNIYI